LNTGIQAVFVLGFHHFDTHQLFQFVTMIVSFVETALYLNGFCIVNSTSLGFDKQDSVGLQYGHVRVKQGKDSGYFR